MILWNKVRLRLSEHTTMCPPKIYNQLSRRKTSTSLQTIPNSHRSRTSYHQVKMMTTLAIAIMRTRTHRFWAAHIINVTSSYNATRARNGIRADFAIIRAKIMLSNVKRRRICSACYVGCLNQQHNGARGVANGQLRTFVPSVSYGIMTVQRAFITAMIVVFAVLDRVLERTSITARYDKPSFTSNLTNSI